MLGVGDYIAQRLFRGVLPLGFTGLVGAGVGVDVLFGDIVAVFGVDVCVGVEPSDVEENSYCQGSGQQTNYNPGPDVGLRLLAIIQIMF